MIAAPHAIADGLSIQRVGNLLLRERIIESIFHIGVARNGQGTGPDRMVGSLLEEPGFLRSIPAMNVADQVRPEISSPDEGRFIPVDDRVAGLQRAADG